MWKKKKHNNDMAYDEIVVEMTPDEYVASLEEFAQNNGAQLIHNPDGTFTVVMPDGAQVTTGIVP